MFIKIKGTKHEPQQKVKRRLHHQRRQKKGTRKTLQFPNQHYDTPRPKSHGICALVASRRKAPWEVEVSKREEWRELVAFEISEARRLENTDSTKPNDLLQQMIDTYRKSKAEHSNDSQCTESVFKEILEDKKEGKDLSFMFASRSFPGPLQCSNDMCRRKHPEAFLSDAGKVCKHCGGRDFKVGKQANSQDKGSSYSYSDLSFLDRYYFKGEKGSSEDKGYSFSEPNTPPLASFSQSSDKGASEDKCSSASVSNPCFPDHYYFKGEKGSSEDDGYSLSEPNTPPLDSLFQSSDKGDSEDKSSIASLSNPCFPDHYLQGEEGLHVDKGVPKHGVFPQRLTTAEYMSRVQEVQRGEKVLTMEEYFTKYGKQ
ncbi:hypothetical protein E2C01_070231 [Portunus trituberculatus]|uniref:Uncharacterized protein n=1 Tax=Portunus trituberculatus TaxID=210409 RepID=A0A5B7I4W1_PORTR|nr:hypothetical protein [Portunus trituberculatus]